MYVSLMQVWINDNNNSNNLIVMFFCNEQWRKKLHKRGIDIWGPCSDQDDRVQYSFLKPDKLGTNWLNQWVYKLAHSESKLCKV